MSFETFRTAVGLLCAFNAIVAIAGLYHGGQSFGEASLSKLILATNGGIAVGILGRDLQNQ